MWLRRENEENVAQTRNYCGGPSSPCWTVLKKRIWNSFLATYEKKTLNIMPRVY